MRDRRGPVDAGIAARFLLKRSILLMSRSHDSTLDLLAGPPPEVLDEIDAAWERAQALVDGELELHFGADHLAHRAFAELRGADGTVEQRLTATEALAIACGDPVPHVAIALAV
jgi:hypothetical protein